MKIKFNGYSATERQVELTTLEMSSIFELMKQHFLTHIEFGTFESAYYSTDKENSIVKLCQNHQVDVEYKKDRLAFFQAIMDKMENLYK